MDYLKSKLFVSWHSIEKISKSTTHCLETRHLVLLFPTLPFCSWFIVQVSRSVRLLLKEPKLIFPATCSNTSSAFLLQAQTSKLRLPQTILHAFLLHVLELENQYTLFWPFQVKCAGQAASVVDTKKSSSSSPIMRSWFISLHLRVTSLLHHTLSYEAPHSNPAQTAS